MAKRKQDDIGGHGLWEIEIAFHVLNGRDPEQARLFTIMRWAEWGDLRPLLEAIIEAPAIDDKMVAIDGAILGCLKRLIEQDRLVVKPFRRGRPTSPDKFARDLAGARLYEFRTDKKKSSAAFRETARDLGMTEAALRDAVTRYRKTNTD